jgi:hypothetical protein
MLAEHHAAAKSARRGPNVNLPPLTPENINGRLAGAAQPYRPKSALGQKRGTAANPIA